MTPSPEEQYSVDSGSKDNRQFLRAISAGVSHGIREALKDEELVSAFWKKGFEELTSHASQEASLWVGRRVLVWLITGAAGIVLFLAVKYKVLP